MEQEQEGNEIRRQFSDDRSDPSRYGGRFVISVRRKNLALDYPPGQRVLLHGLVSARHLNGTVATVVGFRKTKRSDRYLGQIQREGRRVPGRKGRPRSTTA